ncbi:MAG: toxin-antitoxin system protein [Solirubrobacterales bacterium]
MAETTTVRVHHGTREAIARLSKRRGTSAAEFLDELVTRAEEDELLDEMNAAYGRLRADPDAWEAERAERGAWDATLLDGLDEL